MRGVFPLTPDSSALACVKLECFCIPITTMKKTLTGKKVAILVTEGFEQVELTEPRQALLDAGAEAKIITPKGGKIRAWNTDDFGDTFDSDLVLDQAKPEDFDALLLPGGVMNPDKLRAIPEAVTSPLSLRCRPT